MTETTLERQEQTLIEPAEPCTWRQFLDPGWMTCDRQATIDLLLSCGCVAHDCDDHYASIVRALENGWPVSCQWCPGGPDIMIVSAIRRIGR